MNISLVYTLGRNEISKHYDFKVHISRRFHLYLILLSAFNSLTTVESWERNFLYSWKQQVCASFLILLLFVRLYALNNDILLLPPPLPIIMINLNNSGKMKMKIIKKSGMWLYIRYCNYFLFLPFSIQIEFVFLSHTP